MSRLPQLRALRGVRHQDHLRPAPYRVSEPQEQLVRRIATTIPTDFGECPWSSTTRGGHPRAAGLCAGRDRRRRRPLVRVHSECLPGDVFHSRRCDCGLQLRRRSASFNRQGGASSFTCGRRGAGSGSSTRCAPTSSRTRAWTRSRPTPRSASQPTCATTASAPRSSSTSGSRTSSLDQQPAEDRRPRGVWSAHRRARPDRDPGDRGQPEVPQHETRQARAPAVVPARLRWPVAPRPMEQNSSVVENEERLPTSRPAWSSNEPVHDQDATKA